MTVFTFDPQSEIYGQEPDLLINHLNEHGVSAHPLRWPNTGELSAVDAMFASLDTEEADLIVAGAYGHSRWIEGLFGGRQPRSRAPACLAGVHVALERVSGAGEERGISGSASMSALLAPTRIS